jgi:hypothetical protein
MEQDDRAALAGMFVFYRPSPVIEAIQLCTLLKLAFRLITSVIDKYSINCQVIPFQGKG